MRHDSHWVDNVFIELGRLGVRRGTVPVEVGLNGGQFSEQGLRYTYLPAVRALTVDPRSGPRAGGTNVTIRGSNMVGGVDLLCAFNGSAVPASR